MRSPNTPPTPLSRFWRLGAHLIAPLLLVMYAVGNHVLNDVPMDWLRLAGALVLSGVVTLTTSRAVSRTWPWEA